MKNKFFKTTIFSILIVISINSFAQEVKNYFDDGGLANIKTIIKTGYDPINGEIPFFIEQKLANTLSVEGGIGLVFLKKQFDLFTDDPIPDFKNSGIGINLSLYCKAYFFGTFYRGFYMSTGVTMNFFDKTYTDVNIINAGYQFSIKNVFIIDISAGGGFRFFKYTEHPGTMYASEESDSRGIFPVQLKLGYAF
jgi:hypothetical protein